MNAALNDLPLEIKQLPAIGCLLHDGKQDQPAILDDSLSDSRLRRFLKSFADRVGE